MVTGRWQGEGHFIPRGWRKEAKTMDTAVGTAAARGGRVGMELCLKVLTAAVK